MVSLVVAGAEVGGDAERTGLGGTGAAGRVDGVRSLDGFDHGVCVLETPLLPTFGGAEEGRRPGGRHQDEATVHRRAGGSRSSAP